MKRLGMAIIAFTAILGLTGCVKTVNASDEQRDIVAEYMADLLLKHDTYYHDTSASIDKEVSEGLKEQKEEKDSQENDETEVDNSQENDKADANNAKNNNLSLAEVIGFEDIDIQYINYQTYDRYPTDTINEYFSLKAKEGKQLLVIELGIENSLEKAQRISMGSYNVRYQLEVNSSTKYNPLLTLLENDMQHLDLEVEEKETAILVFEIPDDIELSELNLIVSQGGNKKIEEIK